MSDSTCMCISPRSLCDGGPAGTTAAGQTGESKDRWILPSPLLELLSPSVRLARASGLVRRAARRDVVQVQHLGRFGADSPAELRVVDQRPAERRDHLDQLRLPCHAFDLGGETALEGLEHDRDGGRGPGEAPSSAQMEPSAEWTSSVPNCRTPPCSGSLLTIWTRCPATSSLQSPSRACG